MSTRASLILPGGREHELQDMTITIGRLDQNDLALGKTTVSRRHAIISERDGRWFVEDCGSFNGTFLNGTRIQPGTPLPLRHADRIAIGSEVLVFSQPDQLSDIDQTEPLEDANVNGMMLSPFQRQVVECLCASWLAGSTLDELPSNQEIAAQLGTPAAADAVKAALRRAYAKAGLTGRHAYSKRRELCRVARARGWI